MRETEALTYDQALAEWLTEPDFRARWEATALAREVACFLVRYRTERSLSQTALAKQLGMTQSQVSRLEDGEHEPRVATLRRLSDALGMTLTLSIEPPTSEQPEAASRITVSIGRGQIH